MNIKKFAVTGLYGVYDHEIDFSKNNISIIMGPNGVGKTTVLSLIHAIFTFDFLYILNIDFNTITISFVKKSSRIIIEKRDQHIYFRPSIKGDSSFEVSREYIQQFLPRWISIENGSFFDRRFSHSVTLQKIFPDTDLKEFYRVPQWLSDLVESTGVKYIKTQRLFREIEDSRKYFASTVIQNSEEIVRKISSEISNASLITGDLDRTFPSRLLKHLKGHVSYDYSTILAELNELEKMRQKLASVGLLKSENDASIEIDYKNTDPIINNVLHLYINDSKVKLKKFLPLAEKIGAFMDIINGRFKNKIFRVDINEGYVITSSTGRYVIPTDKLSSGEQNELVIFYELLFNCSESDLIIVDEPEISLHLEWLQNMLDDFSTAIGKSGASLLIATHSPDFVGDYYNLVKVLS